MDVFRFLFEVSAAVLLLSALLVCMQLLTHKHGRCARVCYRFWATRLDSVRSPRRERLPTQDADCSPKSEVPRGRHSGGVLDAILKQGPQNGRHFSKLSSSDAGGPDGTECDLEAQESESFATNALEDGDEGQEPTAAHEDGQTGEVPSFVSARERQNTSGLSGPEIAACSAASAAAWVQERLIQQRSPARQAPPEPSALRGKKEPLPERKGGLRRPAPAPEPAGPQLDPLPLMAPPPGPEPAVSLPDPVQMEGPPSSGRIQGIIERLAAHAQVQTAPEPALPDAAPSESASDESGAPEPDMPEPEVEPETPLEAEAEAGAPEAEALLETQSENGSEVDGTPTQSPMRTVQDAVRGLGDDLSLLDAVRDLMHPEELRDHEKQLQRELATDSVPEPIDAMPEPPKPVHGETDEFGEAEPPVAVPRVRQPRRPPSPEPTRPPPGTTRM